MAMMVKSILAIRLILAMRAQQPAHDETMVTGAPSHVAEDEETAPDAQNEHASVVAGEAHGGVAPEVEGDWGCWR